MSNRNQPELYEILNQNNLLDRARLEQGAASNADASRDPIPLAPIGASWQPPSAPQPSTVTANDAAGDTAQLAADVKAELQSQPAETGTATIAAPRPSQPPYNFNLQPPKPEFNDEVFGERRLVLSYDMGLLVGIFALVLLVIVFILGARFGLRDTAPENAMPSVVTEQPTSPSNMPANPAPENLANTTLPPQGENPLDETATPASMASTETVLPAAEQAVAASIGGDEPFFTVYVMSVYQPDEKKQQDIDAFVKYLEEQKFSPVFTRASGKYTIVCVGKSKDPISDADSLVKRAREIKWRSTKTGSLFLGSTAFVKKVAAAAPASK